MKKLNKKASFFFILLIYSIIIFSPSAVNPALYTLPTHSSVASIAINSSNDLLFEIPLFGYKLITTDVNPFERDENASLKIYHKESGFVDIEIHTQFGKYSYEQVQVKEEVLCDLQQYRYEIRDPLNGFFMHINILSDITLINLAFDGGSGQIILDGVFPKGFVQFSSSLDVPLEYWKSRLESTSSSLTSSQTFKQHRKQHQETSVKVSNEKYLNSTSGGSGASIGSTGITYYTYGISIESYDMPVTYPDVIDDRWEDYTYIDIGIYYWLPSENEILSTLQFYNKRFTEDGIWGWQRDIIAFSMRTFSFVF